MLTFSRPSSLIFLVLTLCLTKSVTAQTTYAISLPKEDKKIIRGHLKLGGQNPKGDSILVNNFYVSLNNKPIVPITGEFHFSRYPREYWDESIKKMKAGGINVIATYAFWIIHEENEGKFDWSGDKDIRKFIELCQQNNMYAIVRIGPFCHGEIRSGGFPDWLLGKPLTIRSNDPQYLFYVERLYKEIGKQLTNLYFKDGGPIIGIQIENEFQHSAAPWGLTYPGQPHDFTASERDLGTTQQGVGIAQEKNPYAELGNDHMKVLKSLALKEGMDAPIYTATGWGNAAIIPNESIPVTAAYAYPFWTPKKDLSPFFLYKDMHKNPDYAPVRYIPEDYPAFPAELGSGIMSVYTRRPIAEHKSLDAMINRCLGSGANGMGYYMYHGGSTPRGEHSYFSDEAYGLPKISYDFQAPIGEFGQVREGFHRLKLLHFFVQHFGDVLAPMGTVLPDDAASIRPGNITSLRYAVRSRGSSGFLFLNNFQDDTIMTDKKNLQLKVKTSTGDIVIPQTGVFTLKKDENVIFPFNFSIQGSNLIYATAQLLLKNDDKENPYYVFFAPEGIAPEFSFSLKGTTIKTSTGSTVQKVATGLLVKCAEGISEFTVTSSEGLKTKILVLPKSFALKSHEVRLQGKRHIIFSDAVILENGSSFTVLSDGKNKYSLSVYPKITALPKIDYGVLTTEKSDLFSSFTITLPEVVFPVETQSIGQKKHVIKLPALNDHLNDIFLTVDYIGDTGMGFIDGELVTDEFYKGIPWQIGLRKFIAKPIAPKEMVFYFRPMPKDATYLIDLPSSAIPDFGKQRTYLKVNGWTFTPQYKTALTFSSK